MLAAVIFVFFVCNSEAMNYTGNSASSEFSTTTTPSGSPTSSESTSPQTPPTLATPPPQPPFSDIHCFIDDKLRKEVELFTNNVTVAWDESLQKFHFMVPDKAFRHYQITYKTYQSLTDHEDRSLRFRNLKTPEMVSKNLTEPYTCHYNVRNNNSICVSIHDQLVTVGSYSKNEQDNREKRFVLPNFLSFDKFFSYSDSQGIDYILIHHRGQWIYRINLQMYFLDQNMFFKVFQLITPDGAYAFVDFEHADEFGLVTKYAFDDNHYRYYYSLFSENSGLNTYCVHDKKINGRLMILGREKIEQVKSPMEALRMKLNVAKGDEYEFPTMLRLLFYCSLTYLSIFIATQMIPNRRPLIFKELRHTDREIQRLAPVIETIMGRLNTRTEKMSNSTNTSSDNEAPSAGDYQNTGTIVGESIPMAMVCGLIAGVIFGILCLILHVCLVRCLVKARAKHIPKVRKVKVKKDKKGGKKEKKGKKSKKSDSSKTGTSTASSIAM
ncbi:hypothetical protein L3Y34_002694 [Caenorhabditis briggsae]|uniref:Uncharacterized protein n=1 Tax=Caenorhabditis briggsae TaxID=6238 RepID=A0AAE9ISV9_CAEBR|nr:hypothetical protein L3Y34_002694 [Caenorhabditis briggsae]